MNREQYGGGHFFKKTLFSCEKRTLLFLGRGRISDLDGLGISMSLTGSFLICAGIFIVSYLCSRLLNSSFG